MTESKHTPGPWGISEGPEDLPCVGVFDGPDAVDVAYILTTEEDARLIAAAPDMHAALSRFTRAMEQGHYPELQGVWSDASAALDKAEGR